VLFIDLSQLILVNIGEKNAYIIIKQTAKRKLAGDFCLRKKKRKIGQVLFLPGQCNFTLVDVVCI